jgi:hypothetical protein
MVRAAVRPRSSRLKGDAMNNVDRYTAIHNHTFHQNTEILLSVGSDCLDRLELHGLHAHVKSLKQLLDKHRETITTVYIEKCILVDGKWLEILT